MKKMLKNAVSCTLAGIMAISSLCFSAFGQEVSETDASEAVGAVGEAVSAEGMAEYEDEKAYVSGDFEYYFLDDGTVEISDYRGSAEELIIPTQLDGYKVTAIGDKAFRWCTSLTSITFPYNITSIGDYAFEECYNLVNVKIGNGVTDIGQWVFYNCESLKNVTIGNNLTTLGFSAFRNCTSLTSITLPDSLISIEGCAFYNCTGLTNIKIPNKVETIDASAFYRCTALESVMIGDNVKSIGNFAFKECDNLTDLTIGGNVTSIGDEAFASCDGLTIVTIPNGVISIGNKAFAYCYGLTKIIIPESVTSIGDDVFYFDNSFGIIYYSGSEADWSDIVIGDNSELGDTIIYYNSLGPVENPKIYMVFEGNGQATVKWREVDGAEKYSVCYYLNGKFATVDENVDVQETSYTITGLTNGTKYGFFVGAYGYGAWTSYDTDYVVYATPVEKPVVTAYAGNGKVRLNWTKVSGATKYAIYTYLNGKYSLYKATTATSYTVTGLTNDTNYGFLVKAYVGGMWTSYNAYDLSYATPIAKPVVTAYAGNGRVRLNWTKVSGATKYAVYTYSGGKYILYGNTASNACYAKNLTNGKKYGFLVRAYVNGAWTTYNSSDVAFATPIDKPVITKTVAASGRVRLYWNKVAGATKYAIYTYSGGKYTFYKNTTATAYTVSDLKNGTSYGFLVRAYVNGKWTTYNAYDRVTAAPKA